MPQRNGLLKEMRDQREEYVREVRRYTVYYYVPVVLAAVSSAIAAFLVATLTGQPSVEWKWLTGGLAVALTVLAGLGTTLGTRVMYLAAKKADRRMDNLIADYVGPKESRIDPKQAKDRLQRIRKAHDDVIEGLAARGKDATTETV